MMSSPLISTLLLMQATTSNNPGIGSGDVFQCPQVETLSLSDLDQETAREVHEAVCDIMTSPGFKARLTEKSWKTGCRRLPLLQQWSITGDELYRILDRDMAAFSLKSEPSRRSSTVATTSVYDLRITIRPERFEGWRTGDMARKANMVNTLAHEMTHLIPVEDTNNLFRFTDSYNWLPWCSKGSLVSYGVGNLVEEIWLEQQDPYRN